MHGQYFHYLNKTVEILLNTGTLVPNSESMSASEEQLGEEEKDYCRSVEEPGTVRCDDDSEVSGMKGMTVGDPNIFAISSSLQNTTPGSSRV